MQPYLKNNIAKTNKKPSQRKIILNFIFWGNFCIEKHWPDETTFDFKMHFAIYIHRCIYVWIYIAWKRELAKVQFRNAISNNSSKSAGPFRPTQTFERSFFDAYSECDVFMPSPLPEFLFFI